MLGMAGMMGGGGLSTSSSSSAKSGAGGSTIGDIGFGDNVVGGLKISPWTLGIAAFAIVAGIWAWKH